MEFSGAPYPILNNPKGLLSTQTGLNLIKGDLLILLMTNPRERVMLPEFGTPLNKLLFEPNDNVLINEARETIINSISQWEPRVVIKDIEVSNTLSSSDLSKEQDRSDQENILMIKITFVDPQNIKEVDQLYIALPLPR